MARYLAKGDRENVRLLISLESALRVIEREMTEHKRPSNWLKPLRMAKTWLGKVNTAIAGDIDDDDKKRIRKMIDSYQVTLLPTEEAKLKMKAPGTISISENAWGDLAEAVLESQCQGCKKIDFESCKFRNALIDADVPALEIEPNGCQYSYEG